MSTESVGPAKLPGANRFLRSGGRCFYSPVPGDVLIAMSPRHTCRPKPPSGKAVERTLMACCGSSTPPCGGKQCLPSARFCRVLVHTSLFRGRSQIARTSFVGSAVCGRSPRESRRHKRGVCATLARGCALGIRIFLSRCFPVEGVDFFHTCVAQYQWRIIRGQRETTSKSPG